MSMALTIMVCFVMIDNDGGTVSVGELLVFPLKPFKKSSSNL